jgi:hypothetical protein
MKRKLTTTQQRAANACAQIKKNGSGSFLLIWKESASCGLCPSLFYHGKKIAYAGGCGYDKASAAIAGGLCHLGKDAAEAMLIATQQGRGVRSLQDALAGLGWKLEISEGKTEDHIRVEWHGCTPLALATLSSDLSLSCSSRLPEPERRSQHSQASRLPR